MFRRSDKRIVNGQVYIDQNKQFRIRALLLFFILAVLVLLASSHFIVAAVLMVIILMIVLENRETLLIIQSMQIEDRRDHIYPVVGQWFNYELFIRTKDHVHTKMTLHLTLSNGAHTFENHSGSTTYDIETNGTARMNIPIYIKERGSFHVTVDNVKVQGLFNIQSVNIVPITFVSRLYASYGAFEERSFHFTTEGEANKTIEGVSMEKYSTILYDYSQPFNQIDWSASLKAQEMLVKQTEIPVTKTVVLSLNVGSFHDIHTTIEQQLQEISHMALTLYDHGQPFLIGINTTATVTEQHAPMLYVDSALKKDHLHRLIATFSQDSYIMPYSSLLHMMAAQADSTVKWYHFGPINNTIASTFEELHIVPVIMEVKL